jgi:Holliday junction resolvase RusA-like endonuclease
MTKYQRLAISPKEVEVVIIPGEICDLNRYINAERTNKFMAAKIKKNETDRLTWYFKGKVKAKGKVFIQFIWTTKDNKKDPDNISFAKKFVLDAMVKAGVLENDGRKQIIGFGDSFITGKEAKLEVYYTPIEISVMEEDEN